MDKIENTQLDEILNSILPPNRFEKDGVFYEQQVSKEKCERNDIVKLTETLDHNLSIRQARSKGICPVREDLYHQCFDEIIRQVTIFCPERGLLLLRVRDEIRMTIDAYKTLYDSSVIFGIRKQKQSEDGMEDMRNTIKELEQKKAKLNLEVLELRNKVDV